MNEASEKNATLVKALTVDLNTNHLLSNKEGLRKSQAENQATREALAKQQAAAKALEQQNQQLAKQLQDKAQQADKIQASFGIKLRN
ncbi:hypothetical protein [Providencia huaxiensis]|uniref:hypothetical protein n=1 Tax=Providencia huaxiensis TaxID=2027290 RepID=UPI0034DDA789